MNFRRLKPIIYLNTLLLFGTFILSSILSYTIISEREKSNIQVIQRESIEKGEIFSDKYMESSPFVWKDKLYYLISDRNDKQKIYSLVIYNHENKQKVSSQFGEGLSLASAYVENDKLYIFATSKWAEIGKSEIYLITSTDLKTFSDPALIYTAAENQRIFNTSVTKNSDTNEYVLAIEVDEPGLTHFTMKFLKSYNLENWLSENSFFGKDVYVACPALRYVDGFYYLLYGAEYFYDPNCLDCKNYIVRLSRSKDLYHWETSNSPVIIPASDGSEGISTVDIDLTEFHGRTYIHYSIGDQNEWAKVRQASFNGSIRSFFTSYFD